MGHFFHSLLQVYLYLGHFTSLRFLIFSLFRYLVNSFASLASSILNLISTKSYMVLNTTSDQEATSKIKMPLKSKNIDKSSRLIRTIAIWEPLTSRTITSVALKRLISERFMVCLSK